MHVDSSCLEQLRDLPKLFEKLVSDDEWLPVARIDVDRSLTRSGRVFTRKAGMTRVLMN